MTQNRKRVIRLMEKDPHCHWCGIEVVYWYVQEWGNNGEGRMPANFATLDHIYDRFEIEKRFEAWKNKDESRHVLACNGCNQKRNDVKMKELSITAKSYLQIRQKLAQERKKRNDRSPRATIFRGLDKLIEWDNEKKEQT